MHPVERGDRTPRRALVARRTRARWRSVVDEVALTADGLEIAAGTARLDVPWTRVRAVRSHGPEDADGRPRRVALDVVDPVAPTARDRRLLARLTHGATDRPEGVRTLVVPTAGLDVDPALLLAALDDHLELPGERR